MDTNKPNNFEEYIIGFPDSTKDLLKQVREIVLKSVPQAIEVISYGMPAFKSNGKMLIYFAGYKNHIGFYPTGSGIFVFKKEIEEYKSGKGSIQFPLNQPLPVELITKIVEFRASENLERSKK